LLSDASVDKYSIAPGKVRMGGFDVIRAWVAACRDGLELRYSDSVD
jgi:hypothetical protein